MIDSLKSPENWTFSFGEETNMSTNFYFALNRVYLFKGPIQRQIGWNPASENANNKCTMEIQGSEHMICMECSDEVYAIQPGKISCVSSSIRGLFPGPAKGGSLEPNLRIFCPEGHAYLPIHEGGDCVPCTNPLCSRCFREDLSKCLGCRTDTFLRLDSSG